MTTPAPQARRELVLNEHCRCGHVRRIHGSHVVPGRGPCRACNDCPDHRPEDDR